MEALNFPVLGIPPTIGTDRKISSRGTADISERECLRCFQKTIQSPNPVFVKIQGDAGGGNAAGKSDGQYFRYRDLMWL